MLKACENWLSLVNSCIYYACQTNEIYQVKSYSVDFKAPKKLWNPLNKSVLSKCSFVWNKESLKMYKAQKQLVCRTGKYFY